MRAQTSPGTSVSSRHSSYDTIDPNLGPSGENNQKIKKKRCDARGSTEHGEIEKKKNLRG